MMRVRVLVTLVLIAALVWQSEAKPTYPSSCSRPPYGKGVKTTNCEYRIPYKEGEICRFKCRNGYRRTSGDTSRTCTDKSWSGNMLICEQCCKDPPSSSTAYIRGCQSPYEEGETCTFECRPGFERHYGNVNANITCTRGYWIGESLICL
ncbi:complement factor H-related protein 3-like isoform X2 [Branchiostoma floridae x Branchiostoma japonicum]